MPLSWVRLDANVASHDKILSLLADPSAKRWQATCLYLFSLGWSGGQGTDGFIPTFALSSIHGTPATARLLVKHRLWEEGVGGWRIKNYETRQELAVITETKRVAAQIASRKANCTRWHGKDCGCWKETG